MHPVTILFITVPLSMLVNSMIETHEEAKRSRAKARADLAAMNATEKYLARLRRAAKRRSRKK